MLQNCWKQTINISVGQRSKENLSESVKDIGQATVKEFMIITHWPENIHFILASVVFRTTISLDDDHIRRTGAYFGLAENITLSSE